MAAKGMSLLIPDDFPPGILFEVRLFSSEDETISSTDVYKIRKTKSGKVVAQKD